MHIKRYTLIVMLIMIVVGWYIYGFITQASMPLEIYTLHLPALPIAFWVMVPVFLLYLATVAHMLYYTMIGTIRLRRYKKDSEKLIDALQYTYLGKKGRNNVYKTKRYALMGKLLDNSKLIPNDTLVHVGDEKIDAVLAMLRDLQAGKSVALNKYQLLTSNPLVIQNQINQLNAGELKPGSVLAKAANHDDAVCKHAFVKMIPEKPLYELEKYKAYMSKESLFDILDRVNTDKNKLDVSDEALQALLIALPLEVKEYIKAARILSGSLPPEQRIRLFEQLSERDETATPAYLYTLFDLEMVDMADEILARSLPEEFIRCKAYRALKDSPQHYNIDLFLK